MKKFIITVIVALTALSASAEFRWGPTAGLNISNYYWRQPLLDSNQKCGFQVGVLGEVMIPGIGFGIDFAARYNYQGASVNLADHYVWSSDGYKNTVFRLHSLEIPVNLRFKWTRMDGFEHYLAPFAYIGPVFSFHLSQSDCKAIEHPEGSVGLQFGLGAEILEHLQISASYVWGATYAARTVKLDNLSARCSSWNINLAYLF